MNILIFNCGSSSLTYKIYESGQTESLNVIASGKAYHVGVKSQEAPYLVYQIGPQKIQRETQLPDHATAATVILEEIKAQKLRLDAVGHRFVHGGIHFTKATLMTPQNISLLKACLPLAPIHNPNSLSVMELCFSQLGDIPQFAAFDTAFHTEMPECAYRYALPIELSDRFGLRKFGFHGLSYQYVTREIAKFLNISMAELRLVACHLGTGGSSAAAIAGGRSLDTSMGYSPLPGLVMSTRSGDLDPSIILYLMEQAGLTSMEINQILNKESGLIGISGYSSDLFEIVEQAEKGDQRARLAVDLYVHRLKFYIGGYLAILDRCNALAFTDDIGQRCWQVREAVCSGLSAMGIQLDRTANRDADGSSVQVVSAPGSLIKVLVVPTDEELVIAQEGLHLLQDVKTRFL